jgi:hypothetical protein
MVPSGGWVLDSRFPTLSLEPAEDVERAGCYIRSMIDSVSCHPSIARCITPQGSSDSATDTVFSVSFRVH